MSLEGSLIIKLAAEAADLVCKGAGAAGAVSEFLFGKLMQQRTDAAREILQQEIARGKKRPMAATAAEESAAIVYRYLHAAREGAARVNLRLLAQIIANHVADGPMLADEFLYYADLLAPLRRDELVYLGQLYRYWVDSRPAPGTYGSNDPDMVQMELAMMALRETLVPTVLADDKAFDAAGASLVRTGLLVPREHYAMGALYAPSPLLQQLVGLVDIEAAMTAEPVNSRIEPTQNKTMD